MLATRTDSRNNLLSAGRKNNRERACARNGETIALVDNEFIGMRNHLAGGKSRMQVRDKGGGARWLESGGHVFLSRTAAQETRLVVMVSLFDVLVHAHPRNAEEGDNGGKETDADKRFNNHEYLKNESEITLTREAHGCQ